jgi:hypothetical protein
MEVVGTSQAKVAVAFAPSSTGTQTATLILETSRGYYRTNPSPAGVMP